jgi:5-methylcytosine-specific restriction endonuclease McrA
VDWDAVGGLFAEEKMIETSDLAFPKNEAVRLYGKYRQELRLRVIRRDGHKCVECGMPVVEATGLWASAHMAHIKGVGANGDDTEENTRTLCLKCHMLEHNPKSVPAKG